MNWGTPKVATTQATGETETRVATTQAHAGNTDTRVAFGTEKYGESSIAGSNGYGLAFGAESTGVQGSGASYCGNSLNLGA